MNLSRESLHPVDLPISPCFEQTLSSQLDALQIVLLKVHEQAIRAEKEKREQHTDMQTQTTRCEVSIADYAHVGDILAQTRPAVKPRDEVMHHSPPSEHSDNEASRDIRGSINRYSTSETLGSCDLDLFDRLSSQSLKKNSSHVFGESKHREQKSDTSLVNRIVGSISFELVSATVVVLQSIVLGLQIELQALGVNATSMFHVEVISYFLTAATVVEFILRVRVDGVTRNIRWNTFDLIILVLSFIEILVAAIDQAGLRLLRLVRLCKGARLFRMGRIMRYADSFVKMAYCITSSLPTFFPAFFVMLIFSFAFATLITQITIDSLSDSDGQYDAFKEEDLPPGQTTTLRQSYGRLSVSMYSLGKSISGGVSWGEMFMPLTELHWSVPVMFIFFVSFNVLCLMNIVMSVFVNGAIESTKHFKELMLAQSMQRKRLLMNYLRTLFAEIDFDSSGDVVAEEIDVFMGTENGQAFFDMIGLGVTDARTMMILLDEDGSGAISIDEFCEGCVNFQGDATSFQMQCLLKENHISFVRLRNIEKKLNHVLEMGKPSEATLATQQRCNLVISEDLPKNSDHANAKLDYALIDNSSDSLSV